METFFEWLQQPWDPIVGGIAIGIMVPLLLLLTGKNFGISSTFRHINAICAPNSKLDYLRLDNWRGNIWQIVMAAGVVIGAVIGNRFLSETPQMFLPEQYYSLNGAIRLLIGGILVGFGARWANGCTSGHTIMGISNLQWQSVIASIFFFVGGLITTNFIIGLL